MITARRVLTVPKTALVVMLESPLAGFMASMAKFSEEIASSRPFGRWGITSMINAQVARAAGGRFGRCDGESSRR